MGSEVPQTRWPVAVLPRLMVATYFQFQSVRLHLGQTLGSCSRRFSHWCLHLRQRRRSRAAKAVVTRLFYVCVGVPSSRVPNLDPDLSLFQRFRNPVVNDLHRRARVDDSGAIGREPDQNTAIGIR